MVRQLTRLAVFIVLPMIKLHCQHRDTPLTPHSAGAIASECLLLRHHAQPSREARVQPDHFKLPRTKRLPVGQHALLCEKMRQYTSLTCLLGRLANRSAGDRVPDRRKCIARRSILRLLICP